MADAVATPPAVEGKVPADETKVLTRERWKVSATPLGCCGVPRSVVYTSEEDAQRAADFVRRTWLGARVAIERLPDA